MSNLTDELMKERGDAYREGEGVAEDTALRWQLVADQLADILDEIAHLQPGLPSLRSAYSWDDKTWPDGGCRSDAVREHVRRALAAAYAHTGAYSRAADKLGQAIIDHNAEVEQRRLAAAAAAEPEPAGDALDEMARPVSYREAAEQVVQNGPA